MIMRHQIELNGASGDFAAIDVHVIESSSDQEIIFIILALLFGYQID